MVVEDMPRFEGCTDENCTQTKIMQFIARKTKYPPIAKENNITGRVFVSFVVDKTGIVTNVKFYGVLINISMQKHLESSFKFAKIYAW